MNWETKMLRCHTKRGLCVRRKKKSNIRTHTRSTPQHTKRKIVEKGLWRRVEHVRRNIENQLINGRAQNELLDTKTHRLVFLRKNIVRNRRNAQREKKCIPN